MPYVIYSNSSISPERSSLDENYRICGDFYSSFYLCVDSLINRPAGLAVTESLSSSVQDPLVFFPSYPFDHILAPGWISPTI